MRRLEPLRFAAAVSLAIVLVVSTMGCDPAARPSPTAAPTYATSPLSPLPAPTERQPISPTRATTQPVSIPARVTPFPTGTAALAPTPAPTQPVSITATVTPLPTGLPAPTRPPAPTPWSARPGQTPLPDLRAMQVMTATSLSPDQRWIAASLWAFPNSGAPADYYTRLTVTAADGQTTWTVVDSWNRFGMGYTTPRAFLWSGDGRVFYFTNRPHPDGCAQVVNAGDLYRLDLSSGSVRQVAPPVGLWLSLSPDETKLAYVGYQQNELVIRDLLTGMERSVAIEQRGGGSFRDQAGYIQWSPGGTLLVYSIAIRPCSGDAPTSASVWSESTSIMHVDTITMQQTTRLQADKRLLITVGWPAENTVLLKDKDGVMWMMNPLTGVIIKQ